MQPGQTISPGDGQGSPTWQYNPDSQDQLPAPQVAEAAPATTPNTQSPQPVQTAQPAAPAPVVAQQPAAPQPAPAPQAQVGQVNDTPVDDGQTVSWTASEFIAHAKSAGWYLLLFLGAVAVAALVYWLTKSRISTAVILIVAMLFGISAARQPRELQYQVNDKGVSIGGKLYSFAGFRSFSVVQEGGVDSIWLMPLKRFMPIVSIYFDPKDGDRIVDILAQFLPFENRNLDPVNKLMHRMRF